VRDRAHPARAQPVGQVVVPPHRRVAVVAHHEHRGGGPPPAALGVGAQLGEGRVDDAERVVDPGRPVPAAVAGLVDARERAEHRPRRTAGGEVGTHARRHHGAHVAVDAQPAGHVAAEVHAGDAHGEAGVAGEPPAAGSPRPIMFMAPSDGRASSHSVGASAARSRSTWRISSPT
jgi:hypothetical protein